MHLHLQAEQISNSYLQEEKGCPSDNKIVKSQSLLQLSYSYSHNHNHNHYVYNYNLDICAALVAESAAT